MQYPGSDERSRKFEMEISEIIVTFVHLLKILFILSRTETTLTWLDAVGLAWTGTVFPHVTRDTQYARQPAIPVRASSQSTPRRNSSFCSALEPVLSFLF